MVYCIECGTQLPDGAKFCWKCGTRLPDLNAGNVAPQTPQPDAGNVVPQKPTPRKAAKSVAGNAAPRNSNPVKAAETVCVGKNGNALYVPGQGLYFIWENERVYFLAEGTRELKELWRVNEGYVVIHTLGYHAGQLFFWFWSDSDDTRGHFLYSLNIRTLQVRAVFEAKDFRISELGDDSAFYQGSYYVHVHIQEPGEIIKLELNSGQITRKPMPDFTSMPIPEDWIKNANGSIDPGLLKGQPAYQRFRALNGYGYRCFNYGDLPAVRFSLENPADFTFMPLFTGSAAHDALLTQEKDTIYSYLFYAAGDSTHFYATRMNGNRVVENRVLLDGERMNKEGLHTAQGWWRCGSKLYLYGHTGKGGLLFDMEKEQFLRLKRKMYASEFVEDGKGMTYVFSDDWNGPPLNLYVLPPNWMEIDEEALDRFYRVELPES